MLDILLILAALGGCAWVAVRSFVRPHGVYLRSVVGAGLAVGAALAVWWAASPMISNAGGLGAFLIFCAAMAFAAFVALLACAAATLRHLCGAFGIGPGKG